MGAREVIYDHLVNHPMRKDLSLLGMATEAVSALGHAGYVILSPDEVRGIRDAALEEAAKVAANWGSEIPAEIRALKGSAP